MLQLSEEDTRLYLEIMESKIETRSYIRIIIIGENGVGKTCLLHRLLGETIEGIESTDGVKIVNRCKIRLSDGCDGRWVFDEGKVDNLDEVLVDCAFWDFAGQRHYYPSLSIFLNPNAVHLLVSDITKDIKQINIEDGFDRIGEYVDFWFDSVHSCRDVEIELENNQKYLNPPVIHVFTGIDKCKDNLDERKNQIRQQLMSMLHVEEKLKHLRDMFFVSNTQPSDEDFDNLRSSIFMFGKELNTIGAELPLKWIRLERSLDIMREAGRNILSWIDLTDVASKCSINDENEIKVFLKYQHKVGTIIYFYSLKDHIILNKQWLAAAVGCLISHKINIRIRITPEWKILEDTGKLEPVLIEKLFQEEPEFNEHQGHILNVMELFGIIFKPTTLLDDGQKESSSTYYIPCMISKHASIEEMYKVFSVKNNKCTCTPWLCIELKFMPLDFFNHILCYYINQYPICTEPSTKRVAVYHGMGVFYLDKKKLRKFVLCFSKNTIAIQLWQWKTVEQGKYREIMEELMKVIQIVIKKFATRSLSYLVKLKCSDGHIHNSLGRFTYNELVELGNEYFCEDHNVCHYTTEFFQTWFKYYSEVRYV